MRVPFFGSISPEYVAGGFSFRCWGLGAAGWAGLGGGGAGVGQGLGGGWGVTGFVLVGVPSGVSECSVLIHKSGPSCRELSCGLSVDAPEGRILSGI